MRAITIAAVIRVAVRTVYGFVDAQTVPINKANMMVNTIRMGKPYFLVVPIKHPIAQETTMSKTDNIIVATVLTNIFLNVSEFIAQ